MTVRVDFYVLGDAHPEARERTACRLVEKAWRRANRVFVHTASPLHARKMDELLWTFRQSSFVPHEMYSPSADPAAPILIGDGSAPIGGGDVLINLTETVPAFYERFARIAEVVPCDDDARRAGRERYRHYRGRGCAIESHNV